MISLVLRRTAKDSMICASGSVGGARPCQGRGRGFESRLALFFMQRISVRISFLHEMSPDGLKQNSENSVRGLRGSKVLFGRCYTIGPPDQIAPPPRAFFMQRDIRKDILFLHEKSTKRDKCCMQYFFGYYFMNCIFFAILLRISRKIHDVQWMANVFVL